MNRSTIGSLALGALALMLLGCPQGPAPVAVTRKKAPVRSGPVAAGPSGEQLYQQSCAACHGPDARGLANLGKDLVASEFCRTQSDDQLLAFVKTGRGVDDPLNTTKVPMPPKGGNPALKDEDIRSIVTYLRGLQTPS